MTNYEAVIGLEVHVELNTATKLFCGCPTTFGAQPNTQCCPICMGFPGTLPTLNTEAVRLAVKAGLALNCNIATKLKFDRKNYFYPDLPKAYQITQNEIPLCRDGYIDIETEHGKKRIGISRIHIEEDAGKLIHENTFTKLDFNRCGLPLIEIVSAPEISTAEEAISYIRNLKTILKFTKISDVKMNEGSLRCDINISVRKKGTTELGTRTEIKNLNSFKFIKKAVNSEFLRQVSLIENGEDIVCQTLGFNESNGKTYPLRSKETSVDYRFFPEPDLPEINIDKSVISEIKESISELPQDKKKHLISRYNLSSYDAERISVNSILSQYFESAAEKTSFPKILANLLLGEPTLNGEENEELPKADTSGSFATVAELFGTGEITSQTAKLLTSKIATENTNPITYILENNLRQINDLETIKEMCETVIKQNKKIADDYGNGKRNALQSLIGKIMRESGGRANPTVTGKILEELLGANNSNL